MRILRAHGWTRDLEDNSHYCDLYPDIDPKFLFVNAGYNLRATELQAAIGLIQLGKLNGFVESRRRTAERLSEIFSHYDFSKRSAKHREGGLRGLVSPSP